MQAHKSRELALTAALAALVMALPARADDARFNFGGYGRVGFSYDGEGGQCHRSQVVPFGPRLTEGNYLELDFGYRPYTGREAQVRTLVTLALGDQFFHYDGEWDTRMAIRQAFVEVEDLFGTGLFAWVGSRMWRGDDIYLLDFWPMDDLNTLGGAVGWKQGKTELHLHWGVNRLGEQYQHQVFQGRVPFQAQMRDGPDPFFGATTFEVLDRQRTILAMRAEQRYGGDDGALGVKIRLYGEFHYLPDGQRTDEQDLDLKLPLPDDRGWMLGVQVGLWNFGPRAHLNTWLRYASGLAAYDELAVPYGVNRDSRAVDADEVRIAVSGNYEMDAFAVMFGGYARLFWDADVNEADFDDRQEAAFAVRPMLRLGMFTPGVEASMQISRPNGLDPQTDRQDVARVTQLALIPALTLDDDAGSYSRPQIRFIYAVSLLNQAALDRYSVRDPRSTEDVVHFVGVRAEWWFGRGGGY
ncbi:MAG: carbohydrate porin [Myxococcales bacterium]|nr:carbohydrate porin [Myxococcales bacterium]